MANMSYCRFQNTARDMDDCIEAIKDGDIASEEEGSIALDMFLDILRLLEENAVIEEYDEARLEDMIDVALNRR